MNEAFQLSLSGRLANFRDWASAHPHEKCRLVQYCGFEFGAAIDVPCEEVEREIIGCLSEGFDVDWNLNGKCLVLAVWESWDFPLDWQCIFEERDFDYSGPKLPPL